jgi:hypothetical protein
MKTWIILMTFAISAIGAEGDSSRRVTVHVRYDECAPTAVVMKAERRVTELFASIGVPVRFLPGRRGRSHNPGEFDLELRIQMQAPAGAIASALAHAQPYNRESTILVFYSSIDAYNPREYRDALLGYVFAHEIGHVLEGIARHSESGVMKASWNRADFDQMHRGRLKFHSADAQLIRLGFVKATAAPVVR